MAADASPEDLTGRTVVFAGRLASMTRRAAARQVESRGGHPRPRLTRRTDLLVVGRGAHALLDGDRLQLLLDRARRVGAACLGETSFLRALGLLPAADRQNRSFGLEAIATLSGLDDETLRLLALLDVVEPCDARLGFRDLIAARLAARLLREGVALSRVVEVMLLLRRRRGAVDALPNVVCDGRGRVAMEVGGVVSDLDGQLPLPLPDAGNLSPGDLHAAADRAEEAGDLGEAERLYRCCLRLGCADPIVAFNFANLLCRLGRTREAKLYFWLAVGLDDRFAAGWYNLAHLTETDGDLAAARAQLGRAVDADPGFADAVYNLAHACWECGDYTEAARQWQRYLALDADSAWARMARHGIALCRMELEQRRG